MFDFFPLTSHAQLVLKLCEQFFPKHGFQSSKPGWLLLFDKLKLELLCTELWSTSLILTQIQSLLCSPVSFIQYYSRSRSWTTYVGMVTTSTTPRIEVQGCGTQILSATSLATEFPVSPCTQKDYRLLGASGINHKKIKVNAMWKVPPALAKCHPAWAFVSESSGTKQDCRGTYA